MKDIEEIIKITENLVSIKTGYSLSFIQKVLLKESLLEVRKTYAQIAQENNYSENYIKQGVAPKLWQLLSDALGEKVNRTNCRAVLEQQIKDSLPSPRKPLTKVPQKIALELPEGQVPLNSPFYIDRDFSEKNSYQEISRPGSLIRIQGPKKMGKTSLLIRIIDYAQKQDYHTIRLSLYQAETEIFTSLQRFLRWVCANVTQQLEMESALNRYWDEDVGALVSCGIYFQNYILKEISNPIILAFDEINRILEYPNIARDFLSLLRSWHERSKDTPDWQKIRMIIVHSTDIYIPLNTNQSPLNVGLVIDIPTFTKHQIENLAERHGLRITSVELEKLFQLTGGFPYLVRLALYHCASCKLSLEHILQDAATDRGIFSQHLQSLLWKLQQDSNLFKVFQQILVAPLELENPLVFKLKSLGLVHLEGCKVRVSCHLYREYFNVRLGQSSLIEH